MVQKWYNISTMSDSNKLHQNRERLCVVMPVYNERDAIGKVLQKWDVALSRLDVDYEIRAYNDGSKDDSLAVMQAAAAQSRTGRVKIIDKINGGHGNTILTGYRAAVADGFDWVFQIDSDDEMGPESFEELWRRRSEYDFLVGRRDGRIQAWPRKIVSFISRLCVRLFYGRSVWDVNSPYRLMRVPSFAEFFGSIPLSTFAPNVILSGLAGRSGLKCYEKLVPQHDRTTGEVSIKKWKLLKAAAKSFAQTILFATTWTPLLALIPVGLSLAFLDSTTFIWYDELAMCDGVFMKALHGLSWSGVWACSYNPLYPVSLVVWVKLFGASHFAVCSFTVLAGYLATIAIASVAHRRKWWSGTLSDAAFVFLFWGGWTFSQLLTNARVDVLVLLLVTLFADSLTGRTDGDGKCCSVIVWGALLFLAAPYMLPILFCFGLYLLVFARDKVARRALVKRGFAAAVGFGLGFAITAGYYFVQRDIIRLLGSYVYFNSITGFSPKPFGERLIDGYLYDITALVLLGVSIALGAMRHPYRKWTLFVILIPFLMLAGGRYEAYYSWAFYVPVVVLAITVVAGRHMRIMLVLLAGAVGICFVHPIVNYFNAEEGRDNRAACRQFVERNKTVLVPGCDVVVAADLDGNTGFYYPLVECGVRIWYRGPEMLNGRTDEEKFTEGVAYLPVDTAKKERLISIIKKIQRFMPLLPENGFVMFYTHEEQEMVKPLFEAKGCKLTLIDSNNGYSLWRMN